MPRISRTCTWKHFHDIQNIFWSTSVLQDRIWRSGATCIWFERDNRFIQLFVQRMGLAPAMEMLFMQLSWTLSIVVCCSLHEMHIGFFVVRKLIHRLRNQSCEYLLQIERESWVCLFGATKTLIIFLLFQTKNFITSFRLQSEKKKHDKSHFYVCGKPPILTNRRSLMT